MSYESKHHTIEELHEKLTERGVEVDNVSILQKINYSHLMYRYGKHFIDTEIPEIRYKIGTQLSQIYNLYLLNIEIESLIYKSINKFEHELKASIAKFASVKGPIEYLNKSFYKNTQNTSRKEISDFVDNMINLHEKIVDNYDVKYLINGQMPIWLFVDELAFGQLRMFLKLSGLQANVLRDIGITPKKWIVLPMVNGWRNTIMHMNSLSEFITINGRKYTLKQLLNFIKGRDKEVFKDISTILENTDESKIGIAKDKLFIKLGVPNEFK